jgi:hypothetical protein
VNSLEDRLHTLANHLDKELRSAATMPDASQTRDSELTSISALGHSAPSERVRLRTVTLVSAILVVVACVAAGVVLSRRVDDPPTSGSSASASAPSPFDGGVALIVYMRHGAPADEIDAVRAALVGAANLVDTNTIEYLDTQDMLAEAQRLFIDDAASLAFLTADNVPTMFKVGPSLGATSEQIAQFAQTLPSLPGVLRADTPSQRDPATDNPARWDGGVALIVYMRHGAAADEIDDVRAALVHATDLVVATKLEYLDIEATLAEARRLFVNDPASLANLTAGNAPTMFKVVPAPDATSEQIAQFAQTLLSLPGVLSADTPSQPITEEPDAASEGTAVVATIFDEEPVAPTTDHP